MLMTAYYNEIDPFAAQWLRNLIDAGLIAPGVVDTRSIEDVTPNDLKGFKQCNFFAGIGGWALALRMAGWPDDRPVWTASCPCQPFSAAGKGKKFADEQHLWPAQHWLIGQRRPFVIFGEQSGSAHANDWIDLVQNDVEALGYAFGAVAFPSAGVGAPHIRDRAYWVADADRQRLETSFKCGQAGRIESANGGSISWLADANHKGSQGRLSGGTDSQREIVNGHTGRNSAINRPGPVNGVWAGADWVYCRDNKWRAIKPGIKPLVNGVAGRVGRLRAYGNAVNVYAAAAFIKAYMAAVQ
ncbi:TPA: DNA cytosine methyltransferase [Escherichia coli]|nr:DNA cytosine methyltransferase [Escherichia coli]EFH9533370.1 DNA cytosine methyltransferase [Escherichia coli]MBF2882466.1 DNA cytosine methyltransferase [Escherichia coli]MIB37343.1 DNA cytosine methyltransferase [Escherichia coli]MXE17990.1 DNA cytosine methyltransferase [Escherichia coli]